MKYLFGYCTIFILLGLLPVINIYAQPNASFTVSVSTPTTGCSPLLVKFISADSTTQGNVHSWDFGNSSGFINNTSPNPSRIYTGAQTYTVIHKVVNSSGVPATVTKTAYITVNPTPVANFSSNVTTGCPPLTVNFSNSSNPGGGTITNYTWVFGSGATPAGLSGGSSAANPSAIYTIPGTNNVTLSVTNSFGCVNSVTKPLYITVLEKPVVSFTANNTNFCSAPDTVTFTPTVTGGAPGPYTYFWEFGDPSNSTSSATAPTFIYTGAPPKQYTVKLTVTSANGCKETVVRTNYIQSFKPTASFTCPPEVCLYTPVTFTNTGTITGASFNWYFADGSNTETTQNAVHTFFTPGTYNVRLITNQGGCLDTAIKSVKVRTQAHPQIKMTPDSVCPAPQTIFFSTLPAMSTYKWYFDDVSGISTSTLANPSHTYYSNGEFTVIVEVTDSFGCKDTVKKPLLVKIYPLNIEASANTHKVDPPLAADSGCVQFLVNFNVNIYQENYLPYPYGVDRYRWSFGNGDTSNLKNPSYVYKDSGQYYVFVDVFTTNGCRVRDSLIIRAGYKPIIDSFRATDTVICNKNSVTFISHVRGYDTLLYVWDFGDGITNKVLRDSVVSHLYNICADTYTIKLVVMNKGCKSDTMTKKKYIEVLAPCADFKTRQSCDTPLRVYFTNKSKGDSSRLWRFGDGDTSTQKNPSHLYATAGHYNVWLIVYNDSTHCRDSVMQSVYAGDNPPVFTQNKRELCKGDSVKFFAYLAVDTTNTTYKWFINSTMLPDITSHVTYTFNNPGKYTIRVIIRDKDGCLDTITKTDWITVGGPKAGFLSNRTRICERDTVTFNDTSSAGPGTNIVSRFWYFGTAPNDTLRTTQTGNIKKVYNNKGTYLVGLIVTDNIGCQDTIVKPDFINVLRPVANFTAQSPSCVGIEVLFQDLSTNAFKYKWDFGDGGTDTVKQPKHIYTTMGTFVTSLIVTDTLGCKDTMKAFPIVTTKPIADFTMTDSMSVCPPLIVDFDASISQRATKYNWDFDDGTTPGQKKKHTVVYNAAKEYKIRLIVTDATGCVDTTYKTVQILGYAGAFKYTPLAGCAPFTVNFTSFVKGSVPTMIWDFGDGYSELGDYRQPTTSHTYNTPGRYLPRMIFNNQMGCNIGSDGLDTIFVDGVTADFETGPACQFSQVEFINKTKSEISPLNLTTWTFHDGTFSALKNPRRNYGAAGKYKVKLFVNNTRGCVDSIEKEIEIHTPVKMDVGGDTIICLTDSAQLKPTGGVSYTWSPASTLSCPDCPNPFAFPTKKTVYTVTSTDVNGCHDTDQVIVDIKIYVESIVGKGGEICEGESITLHVSGAKTYIWSPSSLLDNATKSDPSASPLENTSFRVIAYEGSCIPDSNYVEVIVHPKPTVSVRGEKSIVAGTEADLLASGDNIVRFLWSPASTLSCDNCADPVASPTNTTKYTVKVFTIYNCVDSAHVTITVLCDKSQLFIPNSFTPNGDGVNDIFMVRGTGISTLKSFRVYNRWGEVMFEQTDVSVNDKAHGWDGTYKGAQLPPDVYVYTVEAYCENGELLKLKGDVTIIR